MKTIEQRRLEILNDTVRYYSENPKERRCVSNLQCRYSGETLGKNTEGCGIGRLLTLEQRNYLDDKYPEGESVANIFEELPKGVQRLGVDFLSDLQQLHDRQNCWDEFSITRQGVEAVEKIKKIYCGL